MWLAFLGAVQARVAGEVVSLGPPKQRAVAAVLASRANQAVPVEQIVTAVWGSEVPQTAANGVHTYVSGLRRILEPGRGRRETGSTLVSSERGYALRVAPETVDTHLFERRCARVRRITDETAPELVAREFAAALQLWRGVAFSGVPGPHAELERTRLQELRMAVVTEWASVMLTLDRPTEVVAALAGLVAQEPLREPLRLMQMRALDQCGRRAHALEVYQETRQLLANELGIEPGHELRQMQQRILRGGLGVDRRPPRPTAERAGAGAERRAPPAAPPAAPPVAAARAARLPHQLPEARPLARRCPTPDREFVGRRREIAELREMLVGDRADDGGKTTVVAIDGPPGVGKTALALRLAGELAEHFPDGQLLVDLRDDTATDALDATGGGADQPRERPAAEPVLAAVLRALGVDAQGIPSEPAGRTALYRSLLYGRQVMLVVDGASRADQIRPLIPHGPSCVVATTRNRQRGLAARDGAHLLSLGPPPSAEAVELLGTLLGDRAAREGPEVVGRLVARCGRLPLALALLAEQLTRYPDVPLAQVVAGPLTRFGDAGPVGAGAFDTAVTAALRVAYERAYQALPATAARVLRWWGLYDAELISAPAVAALCGIEETTARGQLAVLAEYHLVEEVDVWRYRMPPLVRAFAAARASGAGVGTEAQAVALEGHPRGTEAHRSGTPPAGGPLVGALAPDVSS